MEEYITEITDNVLTLVKKNAVARDETTLTANQYFVLMYYVSYYSYFRNYRQYKGDYYYSSSDDMYYLDFFKKGIDRGYYISKYFNRVKSADKGKVMIVTVNDMTECELLD